MITLFIIVLTVMIGSLFLLAALYHVLSFTLFLLKLLGEFFMWLLSLVLSSRLLRNHTVDDPPRPVPDVKPVSGRRN
jgi:hypothetical protein